MIIITRIYEYMGAPFEVTRTSPESAKVDLNCARHEHREFIVGLMEDETVGWVVGRKEAGYPHTGIFVEAVEHAAGLLSRNARPWPKSTSSLPTTNRQGALFPIGPV